VPAAEVIAAAELYAGARAAFLAYGMGITQHATGTANVMAVSNLVLACGQIGRAGTGINPLRGQNNVQGACDMGALPDVYPGYQQVGSTEANAKFSRAWGRPLSMTPGLTSLGMQQAARDGALAAMLILGEDPVVTDPDQCSVEKALRALDLLVVVELTMTETAKLADVILPAASFAEKDGTFTSCERRVQRVRAAVPPPGEARADHVMLGELARRLGYDGMTYPSAEAIFDELASLTPIYSAMSYARLAEAHGLCWPCDAEHPDGMPRLHEHGFPIGRARLVPLDHHGPAETTDAEYPLVLTTNRLGFHYGCGSMTRKSPLLERETPRGLLYIHPRDAARLRLVQGSSLRVRSRRGEVDTAAMISDEVPEGLVAMPYHFKEAPSNRLTNDAQDPVTRMPELKVCAVSVEARRPPPSPPPSPAPAPPPPTAEDTAEAKS
jgi:formate dehydrogenase major subunit